MNHEFHFVMNEKLYFRLLKCSRRIHMPLSTTIVYIIEHMNAFIEKNHLFSREQKSKYKRLALLKEKRIHIHCYLPEHLYRKMKMLHHDLNIYSIGQIIRKIIKYFLMGEAKYEINKFISKLNKINDWWEIRKTEYKNTKTIFIRHMSYNMSNLLYCQTTYGQDFSPFMIRLLK